MTLPRTVLLMIDLQRDFLDTPGLEPAAGALVERGGALLAGWRARGAPVVHVWTTVRREDDRRMPHWRAADIWRCEAGTAGHATPAQLTPSVGEAIVEKTDYDGFDGTALAETLEALGAEAVVLAGTHLHACVRETALGAYRRRLGVTLAEDAIASDDPLHAAATRAWLEPRGFAFATVDALVAPALRTRSAQPVEALPATLSVTKGGAGTGRWTYAHESPARTGTVSWGFTAADVTALDRSVVETAAAAAEWRDGGGDARAAAIERLADGVAGQADQLAQAIVEDAGKPITQAREEVARSVALLRAVWTRGDDTRTAPTGAQSQSEDRPLGTVALITPWNNPLAIPLGKLAPALVYGNTVVWKPSPAGTRIAVMVMRLAAAAGLPPWVMSLVAGDARTASALMAHEQVDAVALTGGSGAGWAARAVCARRGIPIQAELGGNNPALVADDADLERAACAVAAGAFDFAGQRCTANRRVIVHERVLEPFLDAVRAATANVTWGRPDSEDVSMGPLVNVGARTRVEAAVARALADGATAVMPSAPRAEEAALRAEGAYTPPVVLRCDQPAAEIVQEETFGPVLVVQPASDWTQAIRLANGVRHGLAAAAFTSSPAAEAEFRREVRAGIVKLGTSTAGADVEAPFGGWKHSGVGPPEHGAANRALYTRPRAVYGERW